MSVLVDHGEEPHEERVMVDISQTHTSTTDSTSDQNTHIEHESKMKEAADERGEIKSNNKKIKHSHRFVEAAPT